MNISDSYIIDIYDECSICLEYLLENNTIKILKCKHRFHIECIDKWFDISDNCPLCQKKFLNNTGNNENNRNNNINYRSKIYQCIEYSGLIILLIITFLSIIYIYRKDN